MVICPPGFAKPRQFCRKDQIQRMKAVFLSDAHLAHEKQEGYRSILRFFEILGDDLDHLFIVGDFFDFWFCTPRHLYPPFRPIIEQLTALKEAGVAVTLFEGNHDFFLGDFFEPLGIKVIKDDARYDLDGRSVYVSHGDTVDYTNTSYLRLRLILRSPALFSLQKMFYPPLLWRIARFSSRMSKNHLAKPPDHLPGIMRGFADERFRDGDDVVVLGHGHMVVMEEWVMNGRMKTFCILGDWLRHYSYVTYDKGLMKLHYFDEKETKNIWTDDGENANPRHRKL